MKDTCKDCEYWERVTKAWGECTHTEYSPPVLNESGIGLFQGNRMISLGDDVRLATGEFFTCPLLLRHIEGASKRPACERNGGPMITGRPKQNISEPKDDDESEGAPT